MAQISDIAPPGLNLQASHTPGPWEAREVPGLSLIAIAERGKMMPHATVAKWSGSNQSLGRTDDQDRANARLIAAAPDLLRELKGFVSRWSKYPKPPTGRNLEIYLENAQAAIARAEG